MTFSISIKNSLHYNIHIVCFPKFIHVSIKPNRILEDMIVKILLMKIQSISLEFKMAKADKTDTFTMVYIWIGYQLNERYSYRLFLGSLAECLLCSRYEPKQCY